ncbi:MAG: class I SAM-dependent methyltransferase [Deltaproteobacteria bacterium]|nr:class I SAM-dependent methyltransferase [Deltaproteobacteria bacterium]
MTATEAAVDHLAGLCGAAGLPWSPQWRDPLRTLCDAVAVGSAATNLVGDPSAAGVCAHVVEALAAVACARAIGREPRLVADVGAGAGVAALTYAIAWPRARIVAVEPRRLRAAFVRSAAGACGLAERVIVVQRSLAAAVAAGDLVAGVDLADARAVWPPAEWLARAAPLVGSAGLVCVHVRAGDAATDAELARRHVLARQAVPGPRDYAVVLVRA